VILPPDTAEGLTLAPAHALSGGLFSRKEVAFSYCSAAVIVPVAHAEHSNTILKPGLGAATKGILGVVEAGVMSRRVRLPTPHDSLL
jgi:hypothetical protein